MEFSNGADAGGITAPVPPPPPPSGGGTQRPLRRPLEDRVLFGVASGLARTLGVDPVVVRIAFVALTIFGGSGLLLYLIGLIAIPAEDPGEAHAAAAPTTGNPQGVAMVLGAALIVVGVVSLVGQLFPGLRDLVGPLLLLTAGALVIAWGGRR